MSRSQAHDKRNNQLRPALASLKDARAGSQPTGKTVAEECSRLGLPWATETIPNASIHWIGNKDAKKVIYYFHGGGFGLGAFPGHIAFLHQCLERLEARGSTCVVALLEFGLTPESRYPVQYFQALEGLNLILAKGYEIGDIVLGGDSAGGNHALALLSILTKNHPNNPHPLPLPLTQLFRGAFLISAWITIDTSAPSWSTNKSKDVLNKTVSEQLAADFTDITNQYTSPLTADVAWWKDLPVANVLNVFGEYELLRDDLVVFGRTLETAGVTVRNVECAMHVHIDCVLDAQFGTMPGLMSTEIWDWLEEIMCSSSS